MSLQHAVQPVGAAVTTLEVVEGGPSGTRVALPKEGVEITLGRHDLVRSPPWVVDVDLGRLMVLSAAEGPPVSRDQAMITRRAGEVLVTPKGQAPTLHRPANTAAYATLTTGQAQPIRAGDRLAFGHGGRVLVLEAR